MGAVVDHTDVIRQLIGDHGGEFFLISVPDRLVRVVIQHFLKTIVIQFVFEVIG